MAKAVDRTQKSLPIYPGRLGKMTHDYKRNGTNMLFAALDVAEGIVIEAATPAAGTSPNIGSRLGRSHVNGRIAPDCCNIRS